MPEVSDWSITGSLEPENSGLAGAPGLTVESVPNRVNTHNPEVTDRRSCPRYLDLPERAPFSLSGHQDEIEAQVLLLPERPYLLCRETIRLYLTRAFHRQYSSR
jgi:hypothetical protein